MTADRLEDAAVDTLNVEFVAIAVFSAAPAIADGEIASSPEPWDNNMGESFPKPLAEDKMAGRLALHPELPDRQQPGQVATLRGRRDGRFVTRTSASGTRAGAGNRAERQATSGIGV